SDKVISELSLSGTLKRTPDPLVKRFFISDATLEWDPVMEAFISKGNLGIAGIGKERFFREVPGKLVIEKRASGDVVHLHLEVNDGKWFYFHYRRGVLQAISSDD